MSEVDYSSYLSDAHGPLPFCPGCGHTTLIKALDQALVKLQLDPQNVVVVTDIGCIGLADRYFTTHAFHGLHGRSITYACGLKLARPELTVIVLQGDGGCGIGGTHLLNVARRNIGITLIIGNNFNYGMTGGQHSVTTPTGGITATTPWGNVEGPLDLCATAGAAGAALVHRATAFDTDLADLIARAIEQPGFAMLDVWELCTSYYSPRNRLRRKDLVALIDKLGFTIGQQVDAPRPEYSVSYREAYEAKRRAAEEPTVKPAPAIEKKFGHKVTGQTGIIIAGSAGQKIRSTATIFAQGAMFAGLGATQKDDYPITVQTGHSVAEIIVSPETIEYTGIHAPDYFVLISADGLKRTRARIEKLPASCLLYANDALELPATRAQVRRLPLSEIVRKTGKRSLIAGALGALLAETDLFPVEAFSMAIDTFQRREIAEINGKAVAAGVELVQK